MAYPGSAVTVRSSWSPAVPVESAGDVRAFAARGATVCAGDLDGADYTVDVTSRDSFAAFVAAVIDRFGRIDVLVNNAGVMPLGDFLSEDDAISRTTVDVNLWGLIHGMRLVLPHMIERGRGHS